MKPSPRVLLTIDYEPWFALTRRYDHLVDREVRKDLDGGFSRESVGSILDMLGSNKASFYLVGEIADWYPEVPEMIVGSENELGLHCQLHRPLLDVNELEKDLIASKHWRLQYNVVGYRAPMVGIREEGYDILRKHGIEYSSSIYAPTGNILQNSGITEIPVSSLNLTRNQADFSAPRQFNTQLLMQGEVPFGSSFMIGLLPNMILNQIEKELKTGLSPVIILHPYELFPPQNFIGKMAKDLLLSPQLLPFTINKRYFLHSLLSQFPVSPIKTFLRDLQKENNVTD